MVRAFHASDVEAVLDSWERASRLAHPFLDEAFLAKERIAIAEVYLPASDTWVAEARASVVGFISLLGAEVGGLFVDPAFHSRGLGRALMDRAKGLHDRLEVEVFERNGIGRAFYAKAGFEQIGHKEHAETGQSLLRLAWSRARSTSPR